MADAEGTAHTLHLADNDLANRSRGSVLVYLILFTVIVAFTPYLDDHPLVIATTGLSIFFITLFRAWLGYRFEKFYTRRPELWRNSFILCTVALAAVWGALCAFALRVYALEWTAMLTLLSAAGISAGAISTFSIHRHLILPFLAFLLLPATVTAATLRTQECAAITLMFATYYIFMSAIAIRINKEYWHALRNSVLLDQRALELESSNRELESYSYSIAHDLRAPLRSIIGFSQILLTDAQEKLNHTEKSDLDRVIVAGKRMARLIDDILTLSRITRQEIEACNTDLSELIAEQAQQLVSQEPARTVTLHIEPDLHANVDPRLMGIALQNLLSNAWKFTANRPDAEVYVRSRRVDNETVYSVCDNGVGFDMSYADNLFKPFYRLHSVTDFPGTGIGLATVQRIILRHGGRIWAESVPDQGACFYFTLGPR